MDNTLLNQIKKIGLGEKASMVYTTLLETGGAYPSSIAEITKLNRSTVYKILSDLSIKGLVNEIKKGKKLFYQVEKPSKLVQFTSEQVKIAEDINNLTKKIIPEIQEIYSSLLNKPQVKYFSSPKEILSIYEDQISVEKSYEMLSITTTDSIDSLLPERFYENFRKEKAKIGITTRVLLTDTSKNRSYVKEIYANLPKKIWPVVKFIPAPIESFGSEITIYGTNKVSITNFEKKNPIGVIIEDIVLHKVMKMVFDLAWTGAKK